MKYGSSSVTNTNCGGYEWSRTSTISARTSRWDSISFDHRHVCCVERVLFTLRHLYLGLDHFTFVYGLKISCLGVDDSQSGNSWRRRNLMGKIWKKMISKGSPIFPVRRTLPRHVHDDRRMHFRLMQRAQFPCCLSRVVRVFG
jgi:hypothetical protein